MSLVITKINTRLRYAIVAACFISLAFRLVFFVISGLNVEPTGDEGLLMLQAKHIWQGKELPLLFWGQPYTFPVESYLNAPLSSLLPSNAFGARLLAWFWGLVVGLSALAIIHKMGVLREVWPAYLLILFPSVYWLTLQVAYAPPSYPSYMGLFFLGILFASLSQDAKSPAQKLTRVFLSGFCAGLACSVTLLAGPLLVGLGLFFAMRGQFRDSLKQAGVFSVSALIGLLPHIIARVQIPGAFSAVSENRSFPEALSSIWEIALPFTLSSSFGIRYPYFPDLTRDPPTSVSGFAENFYIVWLILFVAVLVLGGYRLLQNTRKCGWLKLDFVHVFSIVTLLAFLLFGLNSRAYSHSYRYLIPIVMSFPFQVAYLYRYGNRPFRFVLAGLVIFLASINLHHGVQLMEKWKTPDFGPSHAEVPSLQAVIDFLNQEGIRYAYGSWFSAHRLTYATDENIISGQYYNERFRGWPTPYTEQINAQENIAFVLDYTRNLKPERFEEKMALAFPEASYRKTVADFYTIYSNFQYEPAVPDTQIDPGRLTVRPGQNPSMADALLDRDMNTRWHSHEPQKSGMFLNILLEDKQAISRIKLYYNTHPHAQATKLKLLFENNGEWELLMGNIEKNTSIIEMENSHPVVGNTVQEITFPSITTDRLRIEIAEPAENVEWSIGEIKIFRREDGT